MTFSKKDFSVELEKQLNLGYDPKRIGAWAHTMYLSHCGRIDRDLEEIMTDLFLMEEGPEFERTESEMRELINHLKSS